MIASAPERVKVSPSRIKTWLTCPMRWAAIYLEGRRMTATPPMAFGTALHRALEVHHQARWLGRPAGDLLEAFEDALQGSEATISSKERERMREQARGLLELYINRFGEEQVIAAELDLTAPLADPDTGEDLGADLHGIIDLVTAEGRLVDLKTSARSPSDLQAVISNQVQLDAYRYLVSYNEPTLVVAGTEIRSLVRTKEPKLEVHRLALRELRPFLELARRYVESVRSLDIYPRPGLLCNEECPAIAACKVHHGLEVTP